MRFALLLRLSLWGLAKIGLILGLFLALARPGEATPSPADLCEAAAAQAAEETGVPLSVLRAISLAETGRRLRDETSGAARFAPWPWAANQAGAGQWFAARAEAEEAVQALLDSGVQNVDIGCFQINHFWHGAAFASVQEMFDPLQNARYAARLLRSHFEESGDWSLAAGAYHSKTPEFATRYRARFDKILAGLGGAEDWAGSFPPLPETGAASEGPSEIAIAAVVRVNSFPLLRAGGQGQGASLVPLLAPGAPLFGN
jgi:hypothetical protein